MDDVQGSEKHVLPQAHIDTTKQLLEHLYDLPYLQQYFLSRHYDTDQLKAGETPSQFMRRILIEAIDALKPPVSASVSSQQMRIYNLTYAHYIDGMTVQETAHQLDISLRQAYRDLQRGVESIASLIWENHQQMLQESTHEQVAVRSEVDRLAARMSYIDVLSLIRYAERAVRKLAEQQHIEINLHIPNDTITISTDVTVAQQLLVHLLSQLVQQTTNGTINIAVQDHDETKNIAITCTHDASVIESILKNDLIQQLQKRLKWISTFTQDGAHCTLTLTIRSDMQTIVVIDDNDAFVDLIDRYLTGQNYKLIAATNGQDGLRLCHDLVPNVIILDVMIPEMDGWEILQRLRNGTHTAHIPVIVCSVFNDPILASSLGASVFLPKPIQREALIEALNNLALTRND